MSRKDREEAARRKLVGRLAKEVGLTETITLRYLGNGGHGLAPWVRRRFIALFGSDVFPPEAGDVKVHHAHRGVSAWRLLPLEVGMRGDPRRPWSPAEVSITYKEES
jgi:hypothetical protein